jgi:hypothetical protein
MGAECANGVSGLVDYASAITAMETLSPEIFTGSFAP